MDGFRDKLVSKLSAQDMIRANSAADARQLDQMEKQVESYKAMLDNIQKTEAKQQAISETMQTTLNEMKSCIQKLDEEKKVTVEDNPENREKTEQFIHRENVKVYRNVQSAVNDELAKVKTDILESQNAVLETQKKIIKKQGGLTAIGVITMILVLADLAFNIIRYLGIL